MLLFALKKCAFRPQMHQLVRYSICNKNPNFIVYKLMHTNPANEEQKVPVPQLMWHFCSTFSPSIFKTIFSYYVIRHTVDRNFRYAEFLEGAKQAIRVISNALAARNYEILDDMITERSLKLLKHRVDLLTAQQRKFLPINFNDTSGCNIVDIRRLKTADKNKAIIEIKVFGCSQRYDYASSANKLFSSVDEVLLSYVYIFQRKYIDGIGQPWMVKLISYGDFHAFFTARYRR